MTTIIAGSLAVLALISLAAVGAGRLVIAAVDETRQTYERPTVTRYESDSTRYGFPAALEYYSDGRYDDLCEAAWQRCWQAALFTESDCERLHVLIAFSDEPNRQSSTAGSTQQIEHVVGNEPTPVVFGNDDHAYAHAWVEEVTCLQYRIP
ncbi:hypothetical protein [Agromyces sp. NPDC058110]|uniref:hypothetical protein n=1 Tax=Agromyces sp. NPDC058110 TaxID=3346345 RepID=UPI0036DD6F2F